MIKISFQIPSIFFNSRHQNQGAQDGQIYFRDCIDCGYFGGEMPHHA